MGINRGKEFESIIRKAFENVDNTSVIRLYDTMNGYSVKNPCDFVVYHYPTQYLIECKCCYGSSLPIKNITDFQWDSLLDAVNIKGVVAGYIIWFIDKDITVFVSADSMKSYIEETGRESFSHKDSEKYGVLINGNKRKVFWDYDMNIFMKEVNNDNN